MEKLIKIGLAILLMACLFDMSYGYFQFVRFVSLVGFSVLAIKANQKGEQTEQIIYIALALLFQPLIKISLGRTIWNIIDVIFAIGLLTNIFYQNKSSNQKKY